MKLHVIDTLQPEFRTRGGVNWVQHSDRRRSCEIGGENSVYSSALASI